MGSSSEIFSILSANSNMSFGRGCSPVEVQGIAPSVLITSIEFQGFTSPRPRLGYSQTHWHFAPSLGPICPKGHVCGAGWYCGLEPGHKLDHILRKYHSCPRFPSFQSGHRMEGATSVPSCLSTSAG